MRHERIAATDAQALLARALIASAQAAGVVATILRHRSRPWASATFVGEQHAVVLAAARTPALGAWIAALPDAELVVRGHLVASVAVDGLTGDGGEATLTLAILTLEDG